MKKILAVLLLIFTVGATTVYAQDDYTTYGDSGSSEDSGGGFSVYGTLGGHALIWSLGGEILLTNFLGINVEYASWEFAADFADDDPLVVHIVPVYASLYLGTRHRIYLDLGAVFAFAESDQQIEFIGGSEMSAQNSILLAGIGYAYIGKGNGGFYFKAGVFNYYIPDYDEPVQWFRLSAGIRLF